MEEPEKHNQSLPPKKRFSPSPEEQQKSTTNATSYDFFLVANQTKVLKDAFVALSDTKFNPKQKAVIQVGQHGCEFTVLDIDLNSGHEGFGYLISLKACQLVKFECKNPFRKSFLLTGIPELFRNADKRKDKFLFLYAPDGSKHMSFSWGDVVRELEDSFPISSYLKDIDPGIERFPKCLSYVYEGVLHSSILRKMHTKLQKQSTPLPDTVVMRFQAATMEIMASGEMIMSSSEDQEGEKLQVKTEWRHWESLESASRSTTKASVYLVTDPGSRVMVRFQLDQFGDLIFLIPADFQLLPSAPLSGRFRTLN